MRSHTGVQLSVIILVMIFLPIVILICWLCSDRFVSAEKFPRVIIKNGTLEGTFMKSRKGRDFVAFRGIPYAQPPLGKLRFEPPKPFDSWVGVRLAKEDVNICTQPGVHQKGVVGDEDCLYLNVYSPKLPSDVIDVSQNNYSVMIYIHGGGWFAGDGHSSSYGPKFLLDYDIILVTLNYRLGAFGFLSTEDLVSPGNQGMKDQVQAIQWVHENIAAFNGDSNRVTLCGHSAGGVSVHYHMISPLTRGLYHQAISQSGSMLNSVALLRPGIAKKYANEVGKLLDCPTNKSSSLIDCLREKSAEEIIATNRAFYIADFCPMYQFRPVIEPDHSGAFLKEEPEQLLKSTTVAEVPWMTGITSQDGAFRAVGLYGPTDQNYARLFDERFRELAPICLHYRDTCPEKLRDNVTKSIREFYLSNKTIDESTRWNVIDMFTDAVIYIGADNSIRDHLANHHLATSFNSPVYFYFFAYRGSSSFTAIDGDSKRNYGVSHGDELQYLFPMVEKYFPDTPLTEEDLKIVDLMTKLWVNFVKTGNPTPEKSSQIPVKWMPVRSSKIEYLHIGNSQNLHMADNLFANRVKFWSSIPYRGNINLNTNAHRSRDEF